MAVSIAGRPVESKRTLTKRQIEVLSLVSEGMSSRQVADKLHIGKRTVDYHLAVIYDRLDVTNRVQALRRAFLLDLIQFS